MNVIDDVSETALPPSSDVQTHIHQAEKHQQVGVGAALAMIQAALNGVAVQLGSSSLTVVDLFPHTSEFIKATIIYQQEANVR